MKIKKLKINSFGKLENTEIEFSDNINVISGKNESGKSTLLKFIVSMFYGISKNKNGKVVPDFDRYKPWSKEEYSGKLTYTLDDNNEYEIFREFKKKHQQYMIKIKMISQNNTLWIKAKKVYSFMNKLG